MRKALIVATMLGVFGTTGCYRATVMHKNVPAGETIEQNQPFVLWGLVALGDETVNTSSKCPNGLQSVQSEQTFIDGLLGAITFGIYTPITVRYTCAQ